VTAEGLLLSPLVLFALNAPIAVAIEMAAVGAILMQRDFSLMMVVQRMYAGCDSFHLLAVPLFMFTGVIMEAGGISQRIIDLAHALVGWLPGGLAAVTVVSAMFFAGISGSVAADAAAVGSIMIPAMKRSGYDSDFAASIQASGGSIGVVIPPSIPMIIFGFLTGASIGQLFAAGILPGVLMGVSLILVSTFISKRRGYVATATFSPDQVWIAFRRSFLALGAPMIILGVILFGIFTATESAAVAAIYALVVGLFIYRQIRLKDLFRLFREGAVTSAIVMFIITTAPVFSWIAAMEDLPARLAGTLLNLTRDPVYLLLLMNLFLLLAGTFVETTAALILFVPMLVGLLPHLGIDMIQLGAIVVVNIAIGMLTPPIGICLIVSGSISQDSLGRISRRILPFLAVLVLNLMLISFVPPLTLWLARLVAK